MRKRVGLFLCTFFLSFGMCTAALGDWEQSGEEWRYRREDGEFVADGWIRPDGVSWYYLKKDGIMAKGWLETTDGRWFYFHSSGEMASHSWIPSGDDWFFLGDSGEMLKNAVTPDGCRVDWQGRWIRTAFGGLAGGRGGTSGGNGGGKSSSGDSSGDRREPEPDPADREESERQKADQAARRYLDTLIATGIYLAGEDPSFLDEEMDRAVYQNQKTVTLVGRDFLPIPSKLAEGRYSQVSNYESRVSQYRLEDGIYYVNQLALSYAHVHRWVEAILPAGCVKSGEKIETCLDCETRTVTDIPASGHGDGDGDLLCDRCRDVVMEIAVGSKQTVRTGLSGTEWETMDFTCVDEDYGGGYLFLADGVLPRQLACSYHDYDNNYLTSDIRKWLNGEFRDGLSIAPDLVQVSLNEFDTGEGDTVFLLSRKEAEEFYAPWARRPWEDSGGSKAFWTRTGDQELSGYAYAVTRGGDIAAMDVYDQEVGVRPAYVLKKQPQPETHPRMWREGDRQIRRIEGREVSFTCVDESYTDQAGAAKGALFLCDEILAAATDSNAVWYQEWEEDNPDLVEVDVSRNRSFAGTSGSYRLEREDFAEQPEEGRQETARIFSLSLPEAVRYQSLLWSLGGQGFREPVGGLAGYWLRSCRSGEEEMYYAVQYDGKVGAEPVTGRKLGLRPAYVTEQHR